MKPKGIRRMIGSSLRPSMGYTGITVDLLSSVNVVQNQIEAEVEVTKPTEPLETISEGVAVVVTP